METFNREDRYIVIKRSDLKKVPVSYRSSLVDPMFSLLSHLPHRECLVIESDWPEYEPVWRMIERRMNGEPCELAALREELANAKEWSARLDARCVALADDKDALIDRCKAAEQRNAELVELLKRVDMTPLDSWYSSGLNVAVEAAIKPTESGASE